jgi:ABC-type polysaccharide/polyol phosphate export permease
VLAGFANVRFQDTQHLTEVGFQLLFYATPIIYTSTTLEKHGMRWLLTCNPLVAFLELIREPVLHGQVPPPATFAMAVGFVTLLAASAVLVLVRLQRKLIFYL